MDKKNKKPNKLCTLFNNSYLNTVSTTNCKPFCKKNYKYTLRHNTLNSNRSQTAIISRYPKLNFIVVKRESQSLD